MQIAEKSLKSVYITIIPAVKLITNNQEKYDLVKKFHYDPIFGGHCGSKRLLAKLKSLYFWKGMSKDVHQFAKKCHKCQINKSTIINKPLTVITPTPSNPFDSTLIDLCGPYEISESGNRFAITLQCELTKFVVIIPIPNKETLTVAKALIDNFILIFGPFKAIRSDCGSEFISSVFRDITKLFSIDQSTAVAYHPQTIAPLERNHRVLNAYLKMYVDASGSDWDVFAKYYALHWNITPIPQLKDYCPFELVFNRRPNIPGTLLEPLEPIYNHEDLAKMTKYRFQLSNKHAKHFLEELKKKQKEKLDQISRPLHFVIGDKVVITNEGRKKAEPFYKGPYTITDLDVSNAKLVDNLSNKETIVHRERLKKYYD